MKKILTFILKEKSLLPGADSNFWQNLVKFVEVVQTVGRPKVLFSEIKFQDPEEHWYQVLTKSDKAATTPFLVMSY